QNTAHVQFTALQDREVRPHDSEVSLVAISERSGRRVPGDTRENHCSGVTSFLYCNLCDARQSMPVLLHRRQVSNCNHFGVAGDSEILHYLNTPGPVEIRSNPLTCRRRGYAGSPDHDSAANAFSGFEDHSLLVDLLHSIAKPNLNAEFLQT